MLWPYGTPLVSEEGGGPIWDYNACTLEDFPCCARIMHYCKPILDIVFAFVVRCLVEYEKTIAILERTVRRLQRGERRRPVVDSNLTASSEVDSYSSRTTL